MSKAKTASELLAEYWLLSPLEQTTLQLMAFFIAPVTRTSIHEMLKKLNTRVDTRQISYPDGLHFFVLPLVAIVSVMSTI